MRISDWSSDVCSSDLDVAGGEDVGERVVVRQGAVAAAVEAFEHGLADGGVFEVLHDGAGVVEFFAGHDEQDLVVGVDGVVEVGALAGVPVGAGGFGIGLGGSCLRGDRTSTRLNSSHKCAHRMPSSA